MKRLLFAAAVVLTGCAAATGPNALYEGPLPTAFSALEEGNPLLAEELRRLPEFQDGVSSEEMSALGQLVELYKSDPSVFDRAFEQMDQVGLPGARKYCAPLQAVFWLAEDGRLDKEKHLLVNYQLTPLLDEAWVFELSKELPVHITDNIRDEDIDRIIAGIRDEREKRIFQDLRDRRNKNVLINMRTVQSYWEEKDMLTEEAANTLEELLRRWIRPEEERLSKRWKGFGAVTDRLNAPELVNYYQRVRFSYEYARGDEKNPYYLFKEKRGNCSDFTAFSIYCLRKNGYRAWEDHVGSPSSRHPFHIVCGFESHGKKYIMDNGRPDKPYRRGIIPYEEYNPRRDFKADMENP
jgi:hypothetical protein